MRTSVTNLGSQLPSRHPNWRPVLATIALVSSLSSPSTAIEFRRLFDCQPPSPDGYCALEEPSLSADGTCVAIMNDAATPPYWENWPRISFHPVDGGSCPP